MKKVLIAYFSYTGKTESMAQYIAEGIRISGHEVVAKKISNLKTPEDLAGYDGYIFGSPTHFRDIPESMKSFLMLAKKARLKDKLAGAFGSYAHDGNAPAMIFDTLQYVFNMEPFELGAFNLKETLLEGVGRGEEGRRYIAGEVHGEIDEGMRSCQSYGRVFGEKLGSNQA
jgi:flavorubredoxin